MDADKEFMRNALVPSFRHEYLGMLENLKNTSKHFPGGYEFLRKSATSKASPWSMLRPDAALIPCHDSAAYALEGIRFGIDLANKPSVTVKARVKVDEKTNGLSWLWFEELEDFRCGVSKNEALAILNGKVGSK